MVEYCESFLKKNFDSFKFFLPECHDKRIREINMRSKRCLKCPGLENCKAYPNFWAAGEGERMQINEVDRQNEPDPPEEAPVEEEPEVTQE